MHLEQSGRNRRSQCCRQGSCGHKDGSDLRTPGGRKPVAEIENDTREETGFRHAEQKTQNVEARRALHKSHAARDEPPGDHDAGDPDAGAHFMKN